MGTVLLLAQESFDLSSSRLWAWHANHCATELILVIERPMCPLLYRM